MKNLFFVILAVCTLPVFAINKCVSSDGKIVFQDTQCPGAGYKIDVRPSSGPSPVVLPTNTGATPPPTEAARLDALTAQSQRDRRRWDLRDRLIRDAHAQLNGLRNKCTADLEKLRADQYAYHQNLYGKTHAAQVASEMASMSVQCDTKDRQLKGNLDALESECIQLDCRKQ